MTEAIYTKRGGEKHFIIVDAGMNDLIRPTLYDAYHVSGPFARPFATGIWLGPTWLAPFAKPATSWRKTAPCRRSPRAISSQS